MTEPHRAIEQESRGPGSEGTRPDLRPDLWPDWAPPPARRYVAHVAGGVAIRALARDARVQASTVLRQVRRLETQRDDPLIDGALRDLARILAAGAQDGGDDMILDKGDVGGDQALRALRRMARPGAILALARDMETGIIVREIEGAPPERLGMVERAAAQTMALRELIACDDPGARILRYRLTAAGRQFLRAATPAGMAEAAADFEGAGEDGSLRHMRSLLGDSPVAALARRTDRDGRPWLARDLVAAAERLREDFELAQTGPRTAQGWDGFLTAGVTGGGGDGLAAGVLDARARLAAALADLGPGLGDIALRCCCCLEGLESIEARMGWSARSGKVVLRIALQRLRLHYHQTGGRYAPQIG